MESDPLFFRRDGRDIDQLSRQLEYVHSLPALIPGMRARGE